MTDLDALIERVRGATGPDRELDRDIAIAFFKGADDCEYARKVVLSHGARPWNFEVVAISGVSLRTPEPVTGSLDAATALAERCLPGWDRCIGVVDGNAWAEIGPRDTFTSFKGEGPSEAIALVLAILTVIKAQETK